MKRIITSLIGLALALAAAVLPAQSAVGDTQEPSTLTSASAVSVTVTDANLYAAIIEALNAQNLDYTTDATAKTIQLTADANAHFNTLDAPHKHIKNLAGLEQFTGLTWINLSNNLVKTSSQFAGMKNLQYLDLYDNAVRDLSGFSGLTKLEHLNLGDNNEVARTSMTNLSALDTLTSLTWLDFSRNNTPEVTTHIKNLTNLTYLDLNDNGLKDIDDLAGLTKMKVLILNHNSGLAGVSAVKNMKDLEELHVAFCHLYLSYVKDGVEQYGADKTGIDAIFDDDGNLVLTKLRKLDVLCDWDIGFSHPNDSRYPHAYENALKLYDLFKQGKLEFGFYYWWFPDLNTKDLMHTDDSGVKYVTYDDFGAYADGVHDDYYAVFSAHQYANNNGCEVRSTVGGSNAAKNKTYHIFKYHITRDLVAYTNIDWQNATIVIHDENIDHFCGRHKEFLLLYTSPQGSTKSKSLNARMKKVSNPTMNLPLGTATTTITGMSPELTNAINELKTDYGYQRFFVMATNSNKKQFIRHEGLDDIGSGYDQWDGFIVGADGTIEKFNSAKMGSTTPAGSHIPTDPAPVQWDFATVTEFTVIPVPSEQSHVRNARFITIPLAVDAETPRDGGSKPQDYRRNLDFRYVANLEISNITQTLGTAETGWDHNELSGNYHGFLTITSCADLTMTDCYTWDRRTITSSYGLSFYKVVGARLTRVSNSNPPEHLISVGGGRWGNTGNNYGKHLIFDHCDLGRIDAHMGFYDLTVRDCNLGGGGLCLTGAGPLNVERTTVTATSFLNLRSDYGSTWDGEAYITDCTHYLLRGTANEQPHNFVAITPKFANAEQTLAHDFGYELHHPELHLSNFTVDCRYFRGSTTAYYGTYGIVSNYVNGLQKYGVDFNLNYWPNKVQIDGLHFVNYANSLHYEEHARMPLKMCSPVREKVLARDYTVANVTYDGSPLAANMSSGVELPVSRELTVVSGTPVTMPYELVQGAPVRGEITQAQMDGKDIVVEYTGDEPDMAFFDPRRHSNQCVVQAAYYVEHRADGKSVAYFSGTEAAWRWAQNKAKYPEMTDITLFNIRSAALVYSKTNEKVTDGKTQISHVRLMDTHSVPTHDWGAWTQTWAPGCTYAGRETRTDKLNSSLAETRVVAELGHLWGEPTYAWAEDMSKVSATRVCQRDSWHVENVSAPVVRTVTRAATATEPGEVLYTATFTTEGFATQTKKMVLLSDGTEVTELPQSPESPASPASPESPVTAETPDTAATPWTPDVPETAASPATSDAPTTPDTPGETRVGWFVENNSWHYHDAQGRPAEGWVWDGAWYYVRSGTLVTGWLWDGAWYFLTDSSSRGLEGSMWTGWLFESGVWYFLSEPWMPGYSGVMQTGWLWDGAGWYYLAPDGAMQTGWVWDGEWYFLDSSGRWVG